MPLSNPPASSVELESLRGIVEDLNNEQVDVQLWRARYGHLVAIAETKADALRLLARKLDDNSGGYVDNPTDQREDRPLNVSGNTIGDSTTVTFFDQ